MKRTHTHVAFLYSQIHHKMGSKLMRCDQLCELANTNLSDDYTFETFMVRKDPQAQIDLAKHLKGSIVIFLKHALERMHKDAAELIRENARALCIDYIDVGPLGAHTDWYNCHITASRLHESRLKDYFALHPEQFRADATIRHIAHGADIYLQPKVRSGDETYRIGYLGSPKSFLLPDELSKSVDVLGYSINNASDGLIQISEYPIQYAVRQAEKRNPFLINPFTKGFNAAVLSQNILINKQAPDSVYYLGDDYPFLLENNETETIMEGLIRAKYLFGSDEWKRGLDIMRNVQEMSSPSVISSELVAILKYLE